MLESYLHLDSADLRGELLPRLLGRVCLLGRVFHVTALKVFETIRAVGEIRSNRKGEFRSTFGSTNSYFRNRGCVSFFDYRSASAEQIDVAIGKCSPYNLPSADPELSHEPEIAFLFLSDAVHDQLIPWTKWKEEQAYSEKIVPWVEAGYPGSVSFTSISEVLRVKIDYPKDTIADVMRRVRFRRLEG